MDNIWNYIPNNSQDLQHMHVLIHINRAPGYRKTVNTFYRHENVGIENLVKNLKILSH